MTRFFWKSLAILSTPVVCIAAQPQGLAPPPTGDQSPAVIDQHADPVQLRAIRAVQEARDRATKWEEAASEAVAKVPDKELKDQVQKRLNALTPDVAKDLLTTPGEVGVVTIATYKESKAGEPALVSVAYEGLGDHLNGSFFPRVVSDMPQLMRGEKKDTDQPLVLDIPASGYLIYELEKGDLKAAFVAQATMKQSLGAAVQQSRAKTAQIENAEARRDITEAQRNAADQAVPAAATQQPALAPDQSAAQPPADATPNPNYYGSNGYIGADGGYYNTYGWAPYVVIPAKAQLDERKRRELRRAAIEADRQAKGQNQSATPAPPPATPTPQKPSAAPNPTPVTPRPVAAPRAAPAPAPAPAPTPAPAPKAK